ESLSFDFSTESEDGLFKEKAKSISPSVEYERRMSTGNNTPRLLAAAKEFNIGKDTLVAFLTGKGFALEAVKPTTRLTEEMYNALQDEFAKDKATKRKSDSIALPKSATLLEGLNKTEDELSLDTPPEEVKKPETATAAAPTKAAEEEVTARSE